MNNKALQIHHNAKLIRLGSLLQRFYFRPTFLGAEHIDAARPAMYVGNHTIYGVLDSPMIIDYLYSQHHIAIVSLGDHIHFKVPGWNKLVQNMGAIQGLRETARLAMQQGYSILVFPGGGREVSKRKGEEYQLIWKERYGFLELAHEFGYDIAPFVALGGDDVFDLAFDANQLLDQKWFKTLLHIPKIGHLLRQGEIIPSIPRNVIPKRIPFFFEFLPRMSTQTLHNFESMQTFRTELQALLYQHIDSLKIIRESSISD